jgi:hypothetical protein
MIKSGLQRSIRGSGSREKAVLEADDATSNPMNGKTSLMTFRIE